MAMRKFLIVVVALSAAPAIAQTTYCENYLNGIECTQQGSTPVNDIARQMLSNSAVNGYQQGQAQYQQRQLMQQQIQMQHMQNCEYAEAHGYSIRGC